MNKKLFVYMIFLLIFPACELFFPERNDKETVSTEQAIEQYIPIASTTTDINDLPETNVEVQVVDDTYIITREEINNNFVERIENNDGSLTIVLSNDISISRSISDTRNINNYSTYRSTNDFVIDDNIYVEPSESGGTGFWGKITNIVNDGVNIAITIVQYETDSFLKLVSPIIINQQLEDIIINIDKNSTGTGFVLDGLFNISDFDDLDATLKFTDINFFFFYNNYTEDLELLLNYKYEFSINMSSSVAITTDVKLTFDEIPPAIAGPFTIKIKPSISLTYGWSSGSSLTMYSSDTANIHYVVENGILVKHQDFEEFKPTSTINYSISNSTNNYVTLAPGFELNALLFNCLGPFINAELYGTLSDNYISTERYTDIFYSLVFGLSGKGGVKLEFFDELSRFDLDGLSVALEKNLNIAEWTIYPISGVPNSLYAEQNDDGNIILYWNNVRDDLTQYQIQKTVDGGTYDTGEEFLISGIQESYIDSNVVPGQTYYYRIRGKKDDAVTYWTDEIFITTNNEVITDTSPPDEVTRMVFCGIDYTMILKTDGSLWATGGNYNGPLGNGTNTNIYSPVQIMTNVKYVATGYNHTMILKADGTLWGTGYNEYGQLGDGTNINKLSPVQIMSDVKYVSAGYYYSMIIRNDDTLWATGNSSCGYFGPSAPTDTEEVLNPIQIMSNIKYVSAGGYNSNLMIIKNDDTLWTSQYGELLQIMNNVRYVSVGDEHAMILKTDDTLWAIGYNGYGQLGDGTNDERLNPIQIMSSVKYVDACWNHTIIIKNDNTLFTTGKNDQGQLGDGSTINKNSPVQIMEDVENVSGGWSHTMIIKTDGSLWATGANFNGQFGNGTTINSDIPILIDINFFY